MKLFILLLMWCVLWVLCWPLAVAALLLFPIIWLITLPFRLIGMMVNALFSLLRVLLFLPARVFGFRRCRCS